MSLDQQFVFVSNAVPYAPHDIERLRQHWPSISHIVNKKDVLALDTGYLSFDRDHQDCQFAIKKRPTKNHPLSEEDERYNQLVEETRRFIELAFDKVKLRFRILKHKYH